MKNMFKKIWYIFKNYRLRFYIIKEKEIYDYEEDDPVNIIGYQKFVKPVFFETKRLIIDFVDKKKINNNMC